MMNFRLLEIFKAYISFIGIIRVYTFIGYSLKINNYNYACFARYSSFLILKNLFISLKYFKYPP